MDKKFHVIETTLRDGQQSLWATRMTTAMMLPILPVMDRAGFYTIEYMGTAVMDACVRYLDENPWERMRMVKERVHRTPLGMISLVLGFSVSKGAMPDDMSELFFTRCVANGIGRFFFADGLNDIRNFEVPVRAAMEAGSEVLGGVIFSISPVHTDEHFVEKTKELLKLGVNGVILKDPNGVLTPERIRALLPAMRQAAAPLPVWCHSHCVTGLGPATNLEAAKFGAAGIWTCASPLANGSSVPATESMVRHLERMGFRLDLDAEDIAEISKHFRQVAERYGKPLGQPAEYDPSCYEHQMPGGMISNFRAQLAQLGIESRLEEVLEELPRVREELGWSLMVTPFSQIIGTQAALNVLYGRYHVVLDEVTRLAMGHYGKTPSPVAGNIMDRVGRGKAPIIQRPGSLLSPAVKRFRDQQGPFPSDEDLLLAYFFMPETLQHLYAAGPIPTGNGFGVSPLVELVREVARCKDVREFHFVQRVGP